MNSDDIPRLLVNWLNCYLILKLLFRCFNEAHLVENVLRYCIKAAFQFCVSSNLLVLITPLIILIILMFVIMYCIFFSFNPITVRQEMILYSIYNQDHFDDRNVYYIFPPFHPITSTLLRLYISYTLHIINCMLILYIRLFQLHTSETLNFFS